MRRDNKAISLSESLFTWSLETEESYKDLGVLWKKLENGAYEFLEHGFQSILEVNKI